MSEASWRLAHLSNRIQAQDYRTFPRPKGISGRWSVRVIIPMGDGVVCVQHTRDNEKYWIFPGGGIERDETLPVSAVREVDEETHLQIEPKRLLYVRESIDNNDVEFYVLAEYISGEIALGSDPELGVQLLSDVRVVSFDELENDDTLTFYPITIRKRLRRNIQLPPTTALYLGFSP